MWSSSGGARKLDGFLDFKRSLRRQSMIMGIFVLEHREIILYGCRQKGTS